MVGNWAWSCFQVSPGVSQQKQMQSLLRGSCSTGSWNGICHHNWKAADVQEMDSMHGVTEAASTTVRPGDLCWSHQTEWNVRERAHWKWKLDVLACALISAPGKLRQEDCDLGKHVQKMWRKYYENRSGDFENRVWGNEKSLLNSRWGKLLFYNRHTVGIWGVYLNNRPPNAYCCQVGGSCRTQWWAHTSVILMINPEN